MDSLSFPGERKFFDMFDQMAATLTRAGVKFFDMVTAFDQLPKRSLELKQEEEVGDELGNPIVKNVLGRSKILESGQLKSSSKRFEHLVGGELFVEEKLAHRAVGSGVRGGPSTPRWPRKPSRRSLRASSMASRSE